jgi:predicted nucleic-acid-binding protein
VAAFDTNVIVRVLVGDDPVQTKKAERAFVAHAAADGVFVSLVVLAEVSCVLAAAYAWNRVMIHERLSRLLRTRGVFVEELELVQQALDEYLAGKAGLADYLILGKARGVAGGELLTFDRKLAREDGVRLL